MMAIWLSILPCATRSRSLVLTNVIGITYASRQVLTKAATFRDCETTNPSEVGDNPSGVLYLKGNTVSLSLSSCVFDIYRAEGGIPGCSGCTLFPIWGAICVQSYISFAMSEMPGLSTLSSF
jgi:hypothetical protein